MNDTSLISAADDRGYQDDNRPERCISSSKLQISDVDIFFYRYVILTMVAAGLIMNSFFWLILRSSSVPLGRMFNCFLIFISLMEVLQLATIFLEAIWKLVLGLDYLAIAGVDTHGMFVILMLLFCLRALSLYSVIFTVCWLSINSSHHIPFFYSGNTGSLLERLNDCRGYKSLTIILVTSLCITAITEIPVIMMKGPFCVIADYDYEPTFMYMYFHVNRPGSFYSFLRVMKSIIPVCFIAFIVIQFVNIILKLKKSTSLHHKALVNCRPNHTGNEATTQNKEELLPCGPDPGPNNNGNESAIQSKNETNDIQLTFYYLIIPLTIQYFVLWSPYYIVNSVNTMSPFTNAQITNHYVVWVFFSMKLLTSVLNPIFFIFANWKYYKNLILEGGRSRRVTQETNV